MFCVIARMTVDIEKRDSFLRILHPLIQSTQHEPGNRAYEVAADLRAPAAFLVFEAWESETALRQHLHQDYAQELASASSDLGLELSGQHFSVTSVQNLSTFLRKLNGPHSPPEQSGNA
jgi:quinol monooxygenase YgiN